MHLKRSSGKWRPFCLCHNVLSTVPPVCRRDVKFYHRARWKPLPSLGSMLIMMNSPVFDLRLNKRLVKQSWGCCRHRTQYDVTVIFVGVIQNGVCGLAKYRGPLNVKTAVIMINIMWLDVVNIYIFIYIYIYIYIYAGLLANQYLIRQSTDLLGYDALNMVRSASNGLTIPGTWHTSPNRVSGYVWSSRIRLKTFWIFIDNELLSYSSQMWCDNQEVCSSWNNCARNNLDFGLNEQSKFECTQNKHIFQARYVIWR